MAYAALLSLARVIQEIIPHPHVYSRLCSRNQMESLRSNVVFLQNLLEEHFAGNVSSSSMSKHLESRITDVAYHAEDIIQCEILDRSVFQVDGNDYAEHSLLQQMFSRIGCGVKELKLTEYQVKKYSLRGMLSTFGSCIEEVNSVVEEAMKIKESLKEEKEDSISSRGPVISRSVTLSGSSSRKATAVGLDEDLIQIKERVVGNNAALQFIPIVGMGGIGKTTLARMVYQDQLTADHFDVRAWVTVSQDYDAKKILRGILPAKEVDQSDEHCESLIVRVYQYLKGRRFVIIMDDMWDAAAWDCIRRAIPDDNNGSRLILTTRLADIAAKVCSSSGLHRMHLLGDNQSWILFQKEVYGEDRAPSQLAVIGRMISRHCKGLPLTIVVIARLLKLNQTQEYWGKFAVNINEAAAGATRDDNQLFGVLSLSYDNLPPHLKACFLYMSIFPEDHEICCKRLIWLWVAEGFVKASTDKSVEVVAREYLEDLVERNLVFVRRTRSNGTIKTCSVHDILRQLSIRKSGEEKFLCHFMRRYDDRTDLTTVYPRRACVTNAVFDSLCCDSNYKLVRSLLFHHNHFQKQIILGLTFLNVLDAYSLRFINYDFKVFGCYLVNLRYLALSYVVDTDGLQLPSIFNLRNLETLILRPSYSNMDQLCVPEILIFPILKPPKLRHFVVSKIIRIARKKFQIDEIRSCSILNCSLQTVSGIYNIAFTASAIKCFKSLIKLKVTYSLDDHTQDFTTFCLKNLVHLDQLEELNITSNTSHTRSPLADIDFPPNLIKLTLVCCTVTREKMSAIGSLPNLEVLKLSDACRFEDSEWEPVDGQFMQLKYLKLGVENLEVWKVETTHFPRLEQLHVTNCLLLNELPTDVGDINTLNKLVVRNCPRRVGDSARTIQEEQEGYANDQLEVVIEDER